MTNEDFTYICNLLRDRSAVVLEPGKEYLVEARLTPLVRQLQPDVVIGVNETIVTAVDDARSIFASVPTVAVSDAIARDTLPGSRWWLKVGPTNAFGCRERAGAHVDGTKWRVERDGNALTITNLVPRRTPARQLATGFRGDVVDEVCACGSPWPRVVLR